MSLFLLCLCRVYSGAQWPEDFDFEATRALNVKAPVATVTSGVEYGDDKTQKTFEKGSEKGQHTFTEAQSDVDDEGPVIALDPDLDPVSLDKAYRFAARSSVALVCDLSPLRY
jgi:urea-proton symporter